ncbi:hypothetical protein BDZ89DRAFT_1070068 [Hymenopellis radicata]|nr:hypothetical protein BDZ89DRAFT_1070068 [Hymenopellis radicata]
MSPALRGDQHPANTTQGDTPTQPATATAKNQSASSTMTINDPDLTRTKYTTPTNEDENSDRRTRRCKS